MADAAKRRVEGIIVQEWRPLPAREIKRQGWYVAPINDKSGEPCMLVEFDDGSLDVMRVQGARWVPEETKK